MKQNSDLAFKSVGFEWLDYIPNHWEMSRLKSVAELIMGQSPSSGDCSDTPFGLPFLQGCAEFGDIHPKPDQFCLAPPRVVLAGTILMSVRAPVGRLNVADQDYGIGRGLCGIIPNGITLFDDFAYYQLQVMEDALRLVSTGSTYEAVSTGDVGGQVVAIPTPAEQIAIVAYLDYVDQMLRGGVSQKERLVELMEEYKQAVIQQAVTLGLDPDVPLKPSGVEWLGDIPEHWEVRRLRTLARIINGATPSTQDSLNWDGDIGWLTPDDLGKLATRYVHKGSRSITLKGYESCGATLAPSGSLAISTRAPIGHIGILQHEACVNQGCRLLTPNNLVESTWLYFSLKAFNDELSSLGQGSTFTELSRDKLGDFAIALPPLPEQTAIVAHLDKLTSDIDAAIAHTRREIELLEEYRTRLIADVVTGRLDVREAAANLPDVNLDDLRPLAEGGETDD